MNETNQMNEMNETNGTPLLTVCCVAYNHGRYIRDALDGFFKQKTEFPFDVMIHDDASTDDTVAIVREYMARYPGRITLLTEEENQYSKCDKIMARFMFPKLAARYTAFCEGDDYWTDENKLQKQVAFLEAHDDYAFCMCGADRVNAAGEKIGEDAPYDHDCDMPIEDLIRGGGGFIATAGQVTRTKLLKDLPDFYYRAKVGDAPLQLYLAASGKSRYLAGNLCAYRINAPGSWSVTQLLDGSREKPLALHRSMRDMLSGFDAYTDGRYQAALAAAMAYHEFEILRLNCDFAALKRPPYRARYRELSRKARLFMYLWKYCPWAIRAYRKLKAKRGF